MAEKKQKTCVITLTLWKQKFALVQPYPGDPPAMAKI